jgi:SAM-dependent methyltransferase
VLDIGCGDGRYAQLIRTYDLYIGCDRTLEIAKLNYRDVKSISHEYTTLVDDFVIDPAYSNQIYTTNNPRVFFIEAPASRVPAQNSKVNLILAIGLLQHLGNAQIVVDEIIRMVNKERGLIIINTLRQFSKFELILAFIVFFWEKNMRSLLWNNWRKNYYHKVAALDNNLIAHRYSTKELDNLFRNLKNITRKTLYYTGLLNTRFMSREITLVIEL